MSVSGRNVIGPPVDRRPVIAVFVAAFAADLLSKQWAVGHASDLVFNPRPSDLPLRLLMSAVAIVVGLGLSRFAALSGLGRQWGLWIGCALLVAGVLANGVSPFLWKQGIPDFIDVPGAWVWNLADFEIGVGLIGGILSLLVSAVFAYVRGLGSAGRAP